MEIDDFKEVIMMLNTKNAAMIRKYYLNLEKAIMQYSTYQTNI